MANLNYWTAYGVVLYEPMLKKSGNKHVFCRTIIKTESAGEKVYLPVVAFNKKAQVFAALAHKGSTVFLKGTLKTMTTTTSIKAKELLHIDFKIIDFDVLLREPVKVEDIDFADVVAFYDPESFMEEEENAE